MAFTSSYHYLYPVSHFETAKRIHYLQYCVNIMLIAYDYAIFSKSNSTHPRSEIYVSILRLVPVLPLYNLAIDLLANFSLSIMFLLDFFQCLYV